MLIVVDNMAGPTRPFAPPTAHPSTIDPGYQPLFDTTLVNAIYPTGIWSMTNGNPPATEDQCIWTKQQYDDFVLDLEFKTAEGTNSGVIVHSTNTDNWIPNSVEIQIADDYSPNGRRRRRLAVWGHLRSPGGYAQRRENVRANGTATPSPAATGRSGCCSTANR